MMVCLTTSNFPDVMLPAYQINRWNALFFIIYLTLGLFLMMNLLLAIFYSNFKLRFEEKIDSFQKDRHEFLYDQYLYFGGKKGYLNQIETFRMFLMLHCLVKGSSPKDIPDQEMLDQSSEE